jgi:hypothetical protein
MPIDFGHFTQQRQCIVLNRRPRRVAGISPPNAKQSLLGNLIRANASLFVSFATFCKNDWESLGAPGGRALPEFG